MSARRQGQYLWNTTGSPGFEEEYLSGKGLNHTLLLCFIKEVDEAGFKREAIDMLKGAAIPRVSHIIKSIQKNENTTGWMKTMDEDHVSCWLQCLSASRVLKSTLESHVLDQLADRLDLPPAFGGAGVHSLVNFLDEKFMGSFASALVSFCRDTNLQFYIKIA